MINYIHLKNWKTHKDTNLKFSKGTNVLIGMMGAGKSSVLDAVSFALFGTFPALKHKRISVDEVITNRPEQEDASTVKMSFSHEGKEYLVEREVSLNGSPKATLMRDNSYLQSQPERVTEEIEKILRVDYELFSRVIYSEQNRLNYFLELKSSDRKDQIDELLGLDKFAIAEDNTTSLVNRIKDIIIDQERTAQNFDLKKIQEQLQSLEQDIMVLSKDRLKTESELDAIKIKVTETELKLKKRKEEYNKKNEIEKQIEKIKTRMDILDREIKRIDEQALGEKKDIESVLNEANAKFSALKLKDKEKSDAERRLGANFAKINADINQILEKLKEKEKFSVLYGGKSASDFEKEIEAHEKEINELEKMISSAKSRKEEAHKWSIELEKHIAACPVCERELSKELKENLLKAKKQAIKDADFEIKKEGEKIPLKKDKIREIRMHFDKFRVLFQKVKEGEEETKDLDKNRGEASRMEKEIKITKEEREKLQTDIYKLNSDIARLNANRGLIEKKESYKKENAESEIMLLEKEKEKRLMAVTQEDIDELQRIFVEYNSRYIELKTKGDAFAKYLKEKEAQVNDKKEQIKSVEAIYSDITEKKKVAENLARYKNVLVETQRFMRSRLISTINQVMHDIWPKLYPYGDYSSIMLDPSAKDYVLKVRAQANGKERWETVQGVASGGERSIAGLVMRIAFALVLVPNLKWIILDEPTHNIDEQGINRFITVFNENLPAIVDQIFIITHDEALKQGSSTKSYMLSRNKEENGYTKVQEI